MYYYIIFRQLFKFIPRYRFDKKTDAISENRCCKHFSAWRQFLTCLCAQITGKDSPREIAGGSAADQFRLYHLGMTATAKSTLLHKRRVSGEKTHEMSAFSIAVT